MFVALDIQHSKRMRRVVLSAMTSPLQSFSTFSNKRHYFRQKLLNIKFGLILSAKYVWQVSHSKKNWMRCDQNIYCSSCKVHVILLRFYRILNFVVIFSKKNSYIKFYVNHSSGSRVAQCGQSGGRSDRHNEANSRFLQVWECAWYRCLFLWSVLLCHISCNHPTSGMIFM